MEGRLFMNCREIEPLLYLVKEGELDSKEKEMVDRHLASCEDCRRLYQSVLQMTRLVSRGNFDFPGEYSKGTGETVMDRIHRNKLMRLYHYHQPGLWNLARVAAAVLLFFLIFTFVVQENRFMKNRSAMELRMHEAALLSGKDFGEADCVVELKRKLKARSKSPFPRAEELAINNVNEVQLAQYINQLCGANEKDVNSIKKMLKQAGLIINNDAN
jgi:hypothetical protein